MILHVLNLVNKEQKFVFWVNGFCKSIDMWKLGFGHELVLLVVGFTSSVIRKVFNFVEIIMFLFQELETMADPMRKEVNWVRKKIDSVNKELKPLGSTVQKKVSTLVKEQLLHSHYLLLWKVLLFTKPKTQT